MLELKRERFFEDLLIWCFMPKGKKKKKKVWAVLKCLKWEPTQVVVKLSRHFLVLYDFEKVVACVRGSVTNHYRKPKPTKFRKRLFSSIIPFPPKSISIFLLIWKLTSSRTLVSSPTLPHKFKKLHILSCLERPLEQALCAWLDLQSDELLLRPFYYHIEARCHVNI